MGWGRGCKTRVDAYWVFIVRWLAFVARLIPWCTWGVAGCPRRWRTWSGSRQCRAKQCRPSCTPSSARPDRTRWCCWCRTRRYPAAVSTSGPSPTTGCSPSRRGLRWSARSWRQNPTRTSPRCSSAPDRAGCIPWSRKADRWSRRRAVWLWAGARGGGTAMETTTVVPISRDDLITIKAYWYCITSERKWWRYSVTYLS